MAPRRDDRVEMHVWANPIFPLTGCVYFLETMRFETGTEQQLKSVQVQNTRGKHEDREQPPPRLLRHYRIGFLIKSCTVQTLWTPGFLQF